VKSLVPPVRAGNRKWQIFLRVPSTKEKKKGKYNKKAIAALAAGATLLSGLAFAAPAMAEESGAGAQNPPATKPADTPKDPKTPETPKDPKTPAADKDKDDNWLYEPEDSQALADRLNAEKAAKEAAEENDKYEHSPYGNKDMDYEKCVKLYGKDDLACKAVADYLKRHGKKVDDKAAANESDKKAEAKKAEAKKAAPLAKTGAAVALAAVAASVLAGMGAALRKIRH